jgi:hypothetical protein
MPSGIAVSSGFKIAQRLLFLRGDAALQFRDTRVQSIGGRHLAVRLPKSRAFILCAPYAGQSFQFADAARPLDSFVDRAGRNPVFPSRAWVLSLHFFVCLKQYD